MSKKISKLASGARAEHRIRDMKEERTLLQWREQIKRKHLFSIKCHTMSVKWYFPFSEGCLEDFPWYLLCRGKNKVEYLSKYLKIYVIHVVPVNAATSKLDLPPVKNCYVPIGALCSWTNSSSFKNLVNNKSTLHILTVTFFDCNLCQGQQL